MVKKIRKKAEAAAPLKLDFGCGKSPREGFEGVDVIDFGQKWKVDLVKQKHFNDGSMDGSWKYLPWPWPNASVSEAHTSHFIEHLTGLERVHFWNELYRVLVPGGKCQVIAPDFSSGRAYGDPTHQWPPFCAFALYYLSRDWRKANAPHVDVEFSPSGFSCDFAAMGGHTLHPDIVAWNDERRNYAQTWYKEACQDLVITLEKK